jgi:rubrerythrin
MNAMTQNNLRSAYGGESQARTRYDIWGDKAEKEGFPVVARLFRATAQAERIHATLHFNAMKDVAGDFSVTSDAGFGLADTATNLQGAINGEVFEYTQMYPAYIAVAEMQEEEAALKAMRYAIEAEKVHAERFGVAREAVLDGKDLDAEKILLCPVCGYVTFDGDEESCPICSTKAKAYVAY